MTPTADQIEAGARAIHATFVRAGSAEYRWQKAPETIRDNYRNEARECWRAMMEASRHEHD